MSRRTSTLAHALAVCLMVAGMAPVTRAQPLSSGKPQASPLIILAGMSVDGTLPPSPMSAACRGSHWGLSGVTEPE